MQDGVNDRRLPCAPCIKAFDGCGKPQLSWKDAKRVVSGMQSSLIASIIINTSCLQKSRRIHTSAHSVIAETSVTDGWYQIAVHNMNRSMMKFVRQ